ncbi:MAG: universal stress protein [Deltaproteobacteria bacterium]|nr:universal stress protein [Deltaproteobacteria bacterium]
MYEFKRLLVGLNLTAQDEAVLSYAGLITRTAKAEKIYFDHVSDSFDYDKDVLTENPELFVPIDELEKELERKEVLKYYDGNPSTERAFEIHEGNALDVLLKKAKQKAIDLIVIGRKREAEILGTTAARLARKGAVFGDDRSLRLTGAHFAHPGASGLSNNCKAALESAIEIAKSNGLDEIVCQHVYRVPTGYHKLGKSFDEFAAIMKSHAERHMDQFLGGVDSGGVKLTPSYMLDEHPVHAIKQGIINEKADLVVIGSKGRTAGRRCCWAAWPNT